MTTTNEDELLNENAKLRAQVQELKSRKKFGLTFEFKPDDAVDAVSVNIPAIVGRDHGNVDAPSDGVVHELIKGDNFQALTAMLPAYKGKVGVIYIDPPYNTGNKDFIYDDRFVDKTDRFRHSKWLSFMKPRIELAREMLSDDGVIFVSIDDNEQAHLRMLMDEIFGEGNFVSNIVWQNKYTQSNDKSNGLSIQTEFITVYSRLKNGVSFNRKELLSEYVDKSYRYDDNDGKGRYRLVQLYKKKNPKSYSVTSPSGRKWVKPWNYAEERWGYLESNGLIYWGRDGNSCPQKKVYLSSNVGRGSVNLFLGEEYGFQSNGGNEFEKIFGDRNLFSYPKPTSLIKKIVDLHTKKNAIVVDFFAGSGTTLQAVAELNAEDGGSRKCILVTSSGKPDETGVDIADDVTYERCRRVLTGKDWADGCDHPRLEQGLKVSDVVLVSTLDTLETPPVDLVDSDVIEDVVDVADMSQKGAKSAVMEWKRVRGNVRRWERGE